jgi:hypothetical protein
MLTGYIPEKITYYCKPSINIESSFDELDIEFFATTAMPAFPIDPTNEKTAATAKQWAQGYGKNIDPRVIETNNDPITSVEIVGLEIRDQGGRAYKAIVRDDLYVDIREDIILEAILNKGIRNGKFINSEFIWCRIGSQMKLVRVGSQLHEAMLKAHERKFKKKLAPSDLVPGKVYENANGKYLFIGFAKTAEFKINYTQSRGWTRTADKPSSVVKIPPKKLQVWYEIYHDDLNKIGSFRDIINLSNEYSWKGIKLANKSSLLESETQLPTPLTIPDNWMDIIRTHGFERCRISPGDLKTKSILTLFDTMNRDFGYYFSENYKLLSLTDVKSKELNIPEGCIADSWNTAPHN